MVAIKGLPKIAATPASSSSVFSRTCGFAEAKGLGGGL